MAKGECRARHNRVIFTRDLGGDFAREEGAAVVSTSILPIYIPLLPLLPLLLSISPCPCLTSPCSLPSPPPLLVSFRATLLPQPRPREIRPSGLFQCTEAFVISYQFVIQKRARRASGRTNSPPPFASYSLSPVPKRPSSFRVTYGELPCFFPSSLSFPLSSLCAQWKKF